LFVLSLQVSAGWILFTFSFNKFTSHINFCILYVALPLQLQQYITSDTATHCLRLCVYNVRNPYCCGWPPLI
jgi:hypothetical protein